MLATITTRDPRVDWGAQGDARIAQNARNLMRTWTGEAPFMREMGVDAAIMHRSLPRGSRDMAAQIRDMLAIYEPDARVLAVRAYADADGHAYFEADIDTAGGGEGGVL